MDTHLVVQQASARVTPQLVYGSLRGFGRGRWFGRQDRQAIETVRTMVVLSVLVGVGKSLTVGAINQSDALRRQVGDGVMQADYSLTTWDGLLDTMLKDRVMRVCW